jgi:small subunit ribosomal protein S4e
MHIKRTSIGKFWPIARKGTTFLAVASHDKNDSIPLVVVLRDILKLIKNKKELKRLINEKQIKVNQREIVEENYPINLFDVISLPAIKKSYRTLLSRKKKFTFEEITEKEAQTKVFKIISKKILRGKKTQLNLMY